MKFEKYYNKDEFKGCVGVLVSRGYGAGWSTWIDGDVDLLCMDYNLVEMCLQGADENVVSEYLKSKGFDHPYTGGWSSCEVCWVREGESFVIDEYDGNESITYMGDITPMRA